MVERDVFGEEGGNISFHWSPICIQLNVWPAAAAAVETLQPLHNMDEGLQGRYEEEPDEDEQLWSWQFGF